MADVGREQAVTDPDLDPTNCWFFPLYLILAVTGMTIGLLL